MNIEELPRMDPYELGISAAWLARLWPDAPGLGRTLALDVAEFERGLADGRSGICIIRHRDRTEYRKTDLRP